MFFRMLCIVFSGFILQNDVLALKVTNPFKPGSAVVTIGGTVTTLTRSTSCKASKWSDSEENSCICCISKYGLKSDGNFKYDGDHIPHCLKKNHCSEETLNQLSNDLLRTEYDKKNPRPLVKAIINNARVAPSAGTLGEEYHDKGALNPQGVIKALSILANQGNIGTPPTVIEQCFQAQALGGGGSQTLQLFLVSENTYCNRQSKEGLSRPEGVYVVKGLKKGNKEINNIRRLKDSVLGQYSLSNPDRPKGFPSIAFDTVSFTYKDQKRKIYYLSVLPLAPGDSLFNILKSFSQSYKKRKADGTLSSIEHQNTEKRAQHAMVSLGQQLGRLHVAHMTRDKKGNLTGNSQAVHGDMHSNNIFEDIEHNVIFIDSETFLIGLESPRSVAKDLLRIYLFSTIRSASHQNPRKGYVGQTYWHKTIIKPFLREYIRAYAFMDENGTIAKDFNKKNFQDVMRILRKTFSFSGSFSDPEAFYLKAGPISSLRSYTKYISRILDEIETEIDENPSAGGLTLQEELILSRQNFKDKTNTR